MKPRQFNRYTPRVAKPQKVSQAELRKQIVDEIAKDKDKVKFINSKLASAYSLISIAVLYIEEMADILHTHGCYIPFIENRVRMINGNFDGLRNEVNKLFVAGENGKRELMEDIAELSELLVKYFGYNEEDIEKTDGVVAE